jgi:hypothetical protein
VKLIIEFNGEQYEVELPESTFEELQAIAARNGLDFAAALQQAIANEKFLEDQQDAGAKLLIEKDDKLRELVRS